MTQRLIYELVRSQGHLDGFNHERLITRQVLRLQERLSKLALTVDGLSDLSYSLIDKAGRNARQDFDSRGPWTDADCRFGHRHDTTSELANLIVEAMTMAELIGVDIMTMAMRNANGKPEVARG